MTLADRREVIFVGGTPYSGAGVVADLIGALPGVATVPAAVRVHSDPRGIPALLGGRIGLADFVAELSAGELAERVAPEALAAAIATFRASYDDDPLNACGDLFWSLVAQVEDGDSASTLVDASPGNLLEAHTLARLVPESRFVHVVRDGRDVAAAAVEAHAGPARMGAAVEWWADRLRDVERGFRGEEDGAPYAIPGERVVSVVFDELAGGDREGAYRSLLGDLDLDRSDATAGARAARLDPGSLRRGLWRRHACGPAAWWLSRRYSAALRELLEEGNHAAPPLLASRERGG